MTPQEFETILDRRLTKCREVLGTKAKEYAHNGDRLYNFRKAGTINNKPMPEALWEMSTKHLVSVIDLVNGVLPPTQHNVDEKIGDMINYLILLEAVLQECQQQRTRKPRHIDPATVTFDHPAESFEDVPAPTDEQIEAMEANTPAHQFRT